jgi:hypothetical protein
MMEHSVVSPQLIKIHPLWWAAWTLAHGILIAICFLLAGGISYLVVGESDVALVAFALLLALIMGTALGLGQYGLLRLRHIVPLLAPWLLITTTTLMLGMLPILIGLNSWLLSGLLIGVLTGLGQWLLLRTHLHAAGWWMVVMLVPWISLAAIFNPYNR